MVHIQLWNLKDEYHTIYTGIHDCIDQIHQLYNEMDCARENMLAITSVGIL